MIRRPTGCRILLVEDSDALREMMRLVLEEEGYRVDCATCAEDALRLVERHTYDLVLTDFSLPANNGGWLLREAEDRQILRGAATLVVTAETAPPVPPHQEVVFKPVDFNEFLPQIRAMLTEDLDFSRTAAACRNDSGSAVELVLYVSPESVRCLLAAQAMQQVTSRYSSDEVSFRICDVTRDPGAASEDRIIFTPTLVKRSPGPACWMIGDLSRVGIVENLLYCWTTLPARSATPHS